jgi:probable addiction module antidote protein
VNFVLGAMAADYYPRLTGVTTNKDKMGRLVNEQTEIAILLALPGLLFTLAFAPWLLEILYSREFINATALLHWFILGCMARVISWPLGFVMLALGKVYLLALRKVVEARSSLKDVALQSNLSRETLYRTLSAKGNPTLKTLNAVFKATGLEMHVTPRG